MTNQNLSNLNIESMIYVIRNEKVMLDSDLAELYGIDVKRLNEQVKRNIKRFPGDFMFQLVAENICPSSLHRMVWPCYQVCLIVIAPLKLISLL